MNKKIIALILACLCVIVPFMTGCANNNGNKGNGGGGGDIGDPNLTEKNWKGAEFLVLTGEDRTDAQAFNIVDLVAYEDDDMSDPITKAVYERNERILDAYNATIARQIEKDYAAMANDTLAYGDSYGAYVVKVQHALNLALAQNLLDMNSEVDYINLRESWWDVTALESMAVKNKSYFALGDINTVDDDATWCVLFNKKLHEKYQLPNFYDAVKAGDWTIEKLKLWASNSIIDENGDGTLAKHDPNSKYQYGLYFQSLCAEVFLSSAGITPFTKEKNGSLKSNLNSAAMQEAITLISDNVMMDDTVHQSWALNIDNVSAINTGDKWMEIARGGFKANKALFFMCHCGSINLLRDMESDFGILPIPKVTDNQAEYGNTIQYGTANCFVIPYNTPDSSFSGFMLEAMGYLSSREAFADNGGNGSLKYAYYDTTLQRKGARDDDSWDMLDLVFGNRIFDISLALFTGDKSANSINNLIISSTTKGNAWATAMAGNAEAIERKVNESIAYLMK